MNRSVGNVSRMTRHPWRTGAMLPVGTAVIGHCDSKNAYDGPYHVGTVQPTDIVIYNGLPARRRVTLFIREANGFKQIRQTWSNVDGTYDFPSLIAGTYFVIADDYLQQKTIVGADPVQAVLMS